MPCRKENYIFLEQSVTVDSKEVDALVTRIGEALQLHNNNHSGGGGGHHQKTVSVSVSCLHGLSTSANSAGKPANILSGGGDHCMRLRNRRRGQHSHWANSSRASPYHIPSNNNNSDHDCCWDRQIKPWNKKKTGRLGVDTDDDPHRLLQKLILSGNLVKEAVRRLQDCGDLPGAGMAVSAADNSMPC